MVTIPRRSYSDGLFIRLYNISLIIIVITTYNNIIMQKNKIITLEYVRIKLLLLYALSNHHFRNVNDPALSKKLNISITNPLSQSVYFIDQNNNRNTIIRRRNGRNLTFPAAIPVNIL